MWKQNIHPQHIHGQAGGDLVAADVAGGLADTAVVGKEIVFHGWCG